MPDSLDEDLRMMVFNISNQLYALPLLRVREVIAMTTLTPVAFAPPFFKGIINLRGNVISVIDLKMRLCNQEIEKGRETAIIILDIENQSLGLLVDSVEFVCEFKNEQISDPEKLEKASGTNYVLGIAHHQDKLVQIIDYEKAVDIQEVQKLVQSSTTLGAEELPASNSSNSNDNQKIATNL